MKIRFKHRSAQSKMLLALSFGTAIGIIPFTIFRAIQQDWYVALLDLIVVVGMGTIFVYVYKTDKVKNASLVLILVALVGNVISFYLKGIGQANWIYPAMLAAYYIMSPKKGLIVNFIMLSFYVPKLLSSLELINVATFLTTIIITNIIAYMFASGLRSQALILEKHASEDYLTGTGNRRALSKRLEELNIALKNHDKTATIILLDLDYFKKVNDTYGHIRGDEVLILLSQLLACHYKDIGQIYRYGGEEFMVLCSGLNLEDAYKSAQKFRNTLKSNIIIDGKQQTISLGVAEYIKEESNEEWIHRVDLALYQAKNQGRDMVVKA